ncbi:tetratricopeptide repeat protein [Engelhardtia mirabilis]|uniref:Tetratricopeptide repeat protein n=1 Tax=Engelhardtia mirabilis TaxID=2528011 RepID=A0A518BKE1_9BACT|nr:tetratricopeptide repeat protein [Planctomycetes bacterium Pla133]QDV01729.1 tetratricopeptide repeat protein [Planctomycetes bacterium Pla86]
MTRPVQRRRLRGLATLGLLLLGSGLCAPLAAGAQDEDLELEALLREVRVEADRLRLRGDWSAAGRELDELLGEEPSDWRSRVYLGRLDLDRGQHDAALDELERALKDAAGAPPADPDLLLLFETQLEALAELGRGSEVEAVLMEAGERGFSAEEPRLAEPAARGLLEIGKRTRAVELRRSAARAEVDDWRSLLARGQCQRALGDLTGASESVVAAAAACGTTPEAPVLAELADIYFEADGEGQRGSGSRPAGELFLEALQRNPKCESALLGLHAMGRVNWRRQNRGAMEYIEDLLRDRPTSVEGLLAVTRYQLDLGQLPAVRARLARLDQIAPGRRDVGTLHAALAWVEHHRDDCRKILARLAQVDPDDSEPEREVGRHLLELYRFSEGLDFLRSAVERDTGDHQAWTQLGRALANTGDVRGGLEALDRAKTEAKGRHDVWRENTRVVLGRIVDEFEEVEAGLLTFAWPPTGSDVLAEYWVPFYSEARKDLALRYGYSSGKVRIEVFDRHGDFSVRSTGFQGFPALGVCFGPVVTAVSPLSEMRGSFSWARTSYHEFTHVVHLGLSNNRCPRWITEGLATWEETRVNPSWDRNLRRDLLDSHASGTIFPLRELNAAFRGPRIIFGYYQGGLLCRMLIDEFGFPSMIRLLEAFDRGEDLDGAMDSVFGLTPEQIDERFDAFVRQEIAGLSIEPRWDPDQVRRLRFGLDPEPPQDPARLERWKDDWATVAWSAYQQDSQVDAQEALRRAESAGEPPLRALALRGQMAFAAKDVRRAVELWDQFLGAGGDDFFVRVALADLAWNDGDSDTAKGHLLAAEAAYPGFPDPSLSAELGLARLYEGLDDEDSAMAARERWLGWNGGEAELRLVVAAWHARAGRFTEAERLLREANEVDPFRRRMHVDWAAALLELGRFDDVLREVRVARMVSPELDADGPAEWGDAEFAELFGLEAQALRGLGRDEEARERAQDGLDLDAQEPRSRDVLDRPGG